MATKTVHGEAFVKLQLLNVPVDQEGRVGPVRRSKRSAPTPARYTYSPDVITVKKKKKKMQDDPKSLKKEKDIVQFVDAGLSEYELERLENIRQNQAFLSTINLLQASEDLKELSRKKASQRGLKRLQREPAVKDLLPSRKSLRLQHREAETLTLPKEEPTYTQPQFVKKAAGPLPMEAINMEEGFTLSSQLQQLCSEDSTQDRKTALDLKDYRAALKSMRITADQVAKVVYDRTFSVAFHPSSSSLLMATGDKLGRVGLWKMGSDCGDDGVLLFQPHSRPVACLSFSPTCSHQLLSLSYDGSLRCMDLHKALFEDVYDIADGLRTFDFLSHDCSTLLVGNWDGDVAIVDRRTPGNSHESLHSMDPKTLRCVSVHPLQRQYFAVAESWTVNIYDSRCLKKCKSSSVCELSGHSKSISSAYFSPHSGDRVLTTCMDDTIRIYDTSAMTGNAPLLDIHQVNTHNVHTGRYLSKLSAVWDPKLEACFGVGSMARERQVQVYHESGELLHTFTDQDNLSTVQSVVAFHPTRNALAGGNASGRLHVFMD